MSPTPEERLARLEADVGNNRGLLESHIEETKDSRAEHRQMLRDLGGKVDKLADAFNARENQAIGAAFASKLGLGAISLIGGALGAIGIKFGLR